MRTNRKMLNLNLPPIVEALFALKALHLYKSRSLSFLGQSLPFGFLFLDSLRLVLKLSLPERKPRNPQESETTRHSNALGGRSSKKSFSSEDPPQLPPFDR